MNSKIALHIQAAKLGVTDLFKGITPYVGYHHNQNLGDVELYNLTRSFYHGNYLAPNIVKRGRYFSLSKMRSPSYYLVGGGTLIFANNILKHCQWLANYNMQPVFLGTGVLDTIPDTANLEHWLRIFKQARYLGVRGQISSRILREIGVESDVLGDLGFMVNLQLDRAIEGNGELVIIPRSIRPSFYQYFEKDMGTRGLLVKLVEKALRRGIKIKILCVSVDDAPVLRGWIKQLPSIDYIEYDGDFAKFKEIVSTCGCLVSMRMHPGIFASSWGVPTIMLDQRHKFFDSFSVLDSKVVDILDPEKLESSTLLDLVISRLQEDQQSRQDRFKKVTPLAKKQEIFFQKLHNF